MIIYSFMSISGGCTRYGHGEQTENKLTFILEGYLLDFEYIFFSSYFCIQDERYYCEYWSHIDVIARMSIERLRKTAKNHVYSQTFNSVHINGTKEFSIV